MTAVSVTTSHIVSLRLSPPSGTSLEDRAAIKQVLLRALCNCPFLTELYIPHSELFAEDIQVLGNALHCCTRLTYINIGNNSIGRSGAVALAEALQSCGDSNENNSNDRGCSSRLTFLDISTNNIGVVGMRALATTLSRCNALSSLYLQWNDLGDEGMRALATSLSFLPHLTELTVNGNRPTQNGMLLLVRSLHHCPLMAVLDIGDNECDDAVAEALADVMPSLTHLADLGVANSSIGDVGMTALAGALQRHCPLLTQLNVSQNNINVIGVKALAATLSPSASQTQGQEVVTRSTVSFPLLSHINLSRNKISDEGMTILAAALAPYTSTITLLDVSHCGFGDTGAGALEEWLLLRQQQEHPSQETQRRIVVAKDNEAISRSAIKRLRDVAKELHVKLKV